MDNGLSNIGIDVISVFIVHRCHIGSSTKTRINMSIFSNFGVGTGIILSLSVLGMLGFGLGIGTSSVWLWGVALGIFGLQFLWIFLGFLMPDRKSHMVNIGLILSGLILFGIESVVLGLVFSTTWVWVMGLAVLVLMLLAVLFFIFVISAAASRHG